jgi:hypothetical protein
MFKFTPIPAQQMSHKFKPHFRTVLFIWLMFGPSCIWGGNQSEKNISSLCFRDLRNVICTAANETKKKRGQKSRQTRKYTIRGLLARKAAEWITILYNQLLSAKTFMTLIMSAMNIDSIRHWKALLSRNEHRKNNTEQKLTFSRNFSDLKKYPQNRLCAGWLTKAKRNKAKHWKYEETD